MDLDPDPTGTTAPPALRAALDPLRRIVRALRVAAHQSERDLGVSGAQLFVLQQLAAAPAPSLQALADRTQTHQSSVSVVVARLVERGLVARRRVPGDARRSALELTPAGRRLAARAPVPAQTRLVAALAELPPRRLEALARGLAHVADRLDAGAGAPPMFFEETPARRRGGRGA